MFSAANTHVAGDGAVFKYEDAKGKIEDGLNEILGKIDGHLDHLYDEMMARSLRRRATFLSECIQAEIVRQTDLMHQLAHLNVVLQRRIEHIHDERGDESSLTAQNSTAGADAEESFKDELQIEDCREDLEEVPSSVEKFPSSVEKFPSS
ncbi:uncharacterized protein LOC111272205, partial [Varroa jacobsoni]|uniref:uncharacterized protein LOC111272205 n=1 Tax=Varroa jacobsoni TaxID=62625 RepID=UPI000BF460FE